VAFRQYEILKLVKCRVQGKNGVDIYVYFKRYRALKTTLGQVCCVRINESLRKRKSLWGGAYIF
jgi:hypothetical protein